MSTDLAVGSTTNPRKSVLDRDVAMTLAATEYDRVVSLFERLEPSHWEKPTDCPGWDVRAMAGHMLGMAQMAASVSETIRQQLAATKDAKKSGAASIDALTALQVRKNAHLSTDELVHEMRRIGPKAARARRRTPAFVRSRKMGDPQNVDGVDEWWTVGFLLDTILTRDPFLHRIDITRATGIAMQATADHEGVIIDDLVREWAERHGRPYRLELSGPAGGSWGYGGELITLDAFDFCRTISGRLPASGLLATQVPV